MSEEGGNSEEGIHVARKFETIKLIGEIKILNLFKMASGVLKHLFNFKISLKSVEQRHEYRVWMDPGTV